MKLKNYGRNQKKRKEYIKQSGLLLVGVDVSKAKHDACIGTFYNRLKSCGYGVCLVSCRAVKNNRRTMQDGASKTDKKDAYSILIFCSRESFFCQLNITMNLTAHTG